jgi:hypothetical protein
MRRNQQRLLLWLGISILGVFAFSVRSAGQSSADRIASTPGITDWSNHHVIFSKPATAEQLKRVQQDPRYWQQQYRQSSAKLPEAQTAALAPELQPGANTLPFGIDEMKGDWSLDLGDNATVGAGKYPAKYSFSLARANCASDFVVYPTGLVGDTQASIVAYNNLYSGCGGTVPSVYWAYNTGAAVVTSPVFSRDGSQIAFVEKLSSGHGVLLLVKWQASDLESIGMPLTLVGVPKDVYPTCTLPCKTAFFFDNAGVYASDTNSSVFYDYSNDTAYVGDDAGYLHKYTPFFNGVPAEWKTDGWPVLVNPGSPTALTSPVHDYTSDNVFVADLGGFLYQVNATGTAVVTQSGQLDFSSLNDGGPGIVEGPIVDSASELVYVFAPSDGTGGCSSGADCTALFQLPVNFADTDVGSEVTVGNSTIAGTAEPNPLYIGAFDNAYENSVNATGNLYVCGNVGEAPTLYQVPIAAGAFSSGAAYSVAQLTAAADNPACSPTTDVYNPNASGGAAEWAFASVQNDGVNSGCAGGGCLFNFEDAAWQPQTAYAVGQQVLALSTENHKLFIFVVTQAGTSGATTPHWTDTAGATINNDGTVHWIDQGAPSAANLTVWMANVTYMAADPRIIDSNGNVEVVTSLHGGTTGMTRPTWSTTPGGTTPDGTVTWTNAGLFGTFVYSSAGGTSGLIIDNTVGTLAGASQVYFSTLSNQTCGTSPAPGGCAVQASQSELK